MTTKLLHGAEIIQDVVGVIQLLDFQNRFLPNSFQSLYIFACLYFQMDQILRCRFGPRASEIVTYFCKLRFANQNLFNVQILLNISLLLLLLFALPRIHCFVFLAVFFADFPDAQI